MTKEQIKDYQLNDFDSMDLYNYFLFHLNDKRIKIVLAILKSRRQYNLMYSLAINLANSLIYNNKNNATN